MYQVYWDENAKEELLALEVDLAKKIEQRISSYLVQNPKELGKTLTGKYKGLYRYRYGDYRIIYEIYSEEKAIIINRIGHRKNVY
jgi:mRNA interferase RelE/StbE